MAVVTEEVHSKQRRMYMLDLVIKPSPKTLVTGGTLPSDMMWTVYFGESKTAKWGPQQPVAEVPQKQVVQTAPVATKVAVFPTAHTVPKKARNLRYGYRGESKLAPVEAFDNGVFTFLTFSPNNELPILTRVDMVGAEQLVNYRPDARDRNTLIVEGVYPVLVARYEKLSACIVNMERVPNSRLAITATKATK
jgi:type IV secretory pathway VirB9-like protein